MERDEHEHLGDDLRRGENCSEEEVDHDHVAPQRLELGVVDHADFHEREDDDGQFKAQAHAEHELADKADVILRPPLIGREAEPFGVLERGAQGQRHEQEVAEEHAHHEQSAANREAAQDVFALLELEGGQQEPTEHIDEIRRGDDNASVERDLERHPESADGTKVHEFGALGLDVVEACVVGQDFNSEKEVAAHELGHEVEADARAVGHAELLEEIGAGRAGAQRVGAGKPDELRGGGRGAVFVRALERPGDDGENVLGGNQAHEHQDGDPDDALDENPTKVF